MRRPNRILTALARRRPSSAAPASSGGDTLTTLWAEYTSDPYRNALALAAARDRGRR